MKVLSSPKIFVGSQTVSSVNPWKLFLSHWCGGEYIDYISISNYKIQMCISYVLWVLSCCLEVCVSSACLDENRISIVCGLCHPVLMSKSFQQFSLTNTYSVSHSGLKKAEKSKTLSTQYKIRTQVVQLFEMIYQARQKYEWKISLISQK